MLDLLLAQEDLQQDLGTQVGVGGTQEEPPTMFQEQTRHVYVVVREVSEEELWGQGVRGSGGLNS